MAHNQLKYSWQSLTHTIADLHQLLIVLQGLGSLLPRLRSNRSLLCKHITLANQLERYRFDPHAKRILLAGSQYE
jgi:hypothetical protein